MDGCHRRFLPYRTTMLDIASPLRLSLDRDALVANWRWLAGRSGAAACGAAVKADGYGLGARAVMLALADAGCRDFFVATWAEAAALMPLPAGARLSVLHGVRDADMAAARVLPATPVLNSIEQVARWRASGEGRAAHVMVDTGMNRLGVTLDEVRGGALHGLTLDTVLSHLASADEDVPQNAQQRDAFRAVRAAIPARRYSLANSAGLCLGADYAFDLTRPGLALYGGIPRREAAGAIRPVVALVADVLQVRTVRAGESVGYNATWTAPADTRVAIVNLGYADGYGRGWSDRGEAMIGGAPCPVVGRVSMDLTALALPDDVRAVAGDVAHFAYDLPAASAATGRSQYELLTGLGQRFAREWRGIS